MKEKLSALLLCLTLFSISRAQEYDPNSFLNPPKIILKSDFEGRYLAENREFTGIPSLAISPGGRMWSVWYTGPTPSEDLNNYVVLATSGDKGKTWEEVLIIDPDKEGTVRAFDPEVWIDPNGELRVFWAQATKNDYKVIGVWSLKTSVPDKAVPEWTKPVRLTDGVMMCKPIVLSGGEWILPVSTWRHNDNSAKVIVSDDGGQTWQERGAVNVPDKFRDYDKHMIVERNNGTLWMLVRTKYGIGESVSLDKGYTWSPLIQSRIQHTSARFFIQRLNSGHLLLVKHGPIDMKTARSHLMAFISKDDGCSWSNGLLLDERTGISYPDGQQTSDGTIYITYDYSRVKNQNILFTSFSEDDILSGNDRKIVEVFNRRAIISKGGGNKD